jgi:Tol biopolymer transport system component
MELSFRILAAILMNQPSPASIASLCMIALLSLTTHALGHEPLLEGQPKKSDARVPTIGYTEFRTNLPGGRHANIATMRAAVLSLDGSPRRLIAEHLSRQPDTWTQFVGWSPDGQSAIIGQGWESPDNARWEEEQHQFRYTPEGWRFDMNLIDLVTGSTVNLTAIERVSFHNSGLFFWPNDPNHLGFTALIGTDSHPFRMDRDGKNKEDLTKNSREFAYGFSASPSGDRIAYHKSYQIFIANADGSNALKVPTGNPFNFAPQWSPDGQHLLFVSGEHYHCHPHIVKADGTALRKLADRGGYRGVTEFLDVPDFHGGSSDIPAWSADGRSVFYTAQSGPGVDLFRITLDKSAMPEPLTQAPKGSTHYHPVPSKDGEWLAFGSKRDGVRQLHAIHLPTHTETQLTHNRPGQAALWPHWQPRQE